MKKIIIYFVLFTVILSGCEKIYLPKIENRENIIVADARIINGHDENYIKLYKSLGFNDPKSIYPAVEGAAVSIIDSNNKVYQIPEESNGNFRVDFQLNPGLEYKIKIDYGGDSYESTFESVLEPPELDSIYGIQEVQVVREGGENSVNDFRYKVGVQLYADIQNKNELQHYRFSARKTYQYTFPVEVMQMGELVIETMFAWKTVYPQGAYNIAAPPEYSSSVDIKKHPLFFIERSAGVTLEQLFSGWIIFLHQYSLSKSTYDFYNDLNNQLDADGRLFDPLYVQARNNLTCTNNPEQIILGNFEITSTVERRYYIRYISDELGYMIKPINHFYDIPVEGEQITVPPDFWEPK